MISEFLILIQGVIGILLWIDQSRPEGGSMHILYGVVGASGLPGIYTIIKERHQRYEMFVYGGAYLCLSALVIRSMVTG